MKFFNSASTFRTWLAKHHRTKRELLVGFHKKHTGTSSVSYTEALDVVLCYGWIDGVRRRVDDDRYTIRFTPRLPRSKWSAVNIKKANALVKAGVMQPAGAAAFAVKDAGNAKIYAYEVPPRQAHQRLRSAEAPPQRYRCCKYGLIEGTKANP